MLAATLPLTWFPALTPRAFAQGGVAEWTNRYNGPANGDDFATAIAVDSRGNVFVTGYSRSGAGGDTDYDYATIAYSISGVPLWTNRYNSPGNSDDRANAIAVDGNGNVFVTGRSLDSASNYDYATIKYSGSGVPMWTNRYNGPGNSEDEAHAIAVDSSGNVFVTGHSFSGGDYASSDYATVAYSNGGVPLWTNRYNGPGNDEDRAAAIAVDSTGNVFVTGSSGGSSGLPEYATVAYSGAGVPLWTNHFGQGFASGVAVGRSGNVFVTGSSIGSGSDNDYATLAYSSSGTPQWTNIYHGPLSGGPDQARAIAVDSDGNVFVTGNSFNADLTTSDYATVAYSSTGVPLWTNRYDLMNGSDTASAVAVDSSGNVFVTGCSTGSGVYCHYATLAYSGAGVPLWTNRYNGSDNNDAIAVAMAVDRHGGVFVTGYSYHSGQVNADYATVKYSSSVPPVLLDFQRLNDRLVLSWTNALHEFPDRPAEILSASSSVVVIHN